jgi:hypothetical protein
VEAANAQEKLKNKYELISAPSMVRLDNWFRILPLMKRQDSEVWINELEDFYVRHVDMALSLPENQFMIQ